MKLSFPISTLNAHTYFFAISEKRLHENSGVQRGGANGATATGIQRVKSQKFKCCNYMIFPIVRLLTYAAWI